MDTIRIGCVGLGRLGRRHAANVASRISGVELAAVCSVVPEELSLASVDWPGVGTYARYEDMVEAGGLDAVLIASPSALHCRQTETALEAGLHVFCEKPLSLDLDEATRTRDLVARHTGKVFMLGFMRRYDASYAYAKDLVDRGKIGTPFMVRSYGLDPESAIPGLLGFLGHSGGIFLDMAIHDIDTARWFLGAEADTIYAIGGVYRHEEFARHGDADNAATLIRFSNGAMAFIYVSRTCAHGLHVETEIVGTHGSLRIGTTPEKNLTTVFDERGAVRECVGGFLERFDQAYLKEVEEFVACIREGRQPAVTATDGVEGTRTAHACAEALASGGLVKVRGGS